MVKMRREKKLNRNLLAFIIILDGTVNEKSGVRIAFGDTAEILVSNS